MLPVLLLAAGSSTRLGRPKQLLSWGTTTLLRHSAETALAAELGPVIVVLGAVDEPCREALRELPVRVVGNPLWEEGMGSSIAAGMASISEADAEGVLIALADQPAVTAETMRGLAKAFRRGESSMVASAYAGTHGPPAVFAARMFGRLRGLSGKAGAKALFADGEVTGVPCPEAELDIDTEADLQRATGGTQTGSLVT